MSESVTDLHAPQAWLAVGVVVVVGILMLVILIHGLHQQERAAQILPVAATATADAAPPRGMLGFAFHLAGPVEGGILVTQVIAGSPAEDAGLQPGDYITSFISRNAADKADRWSGLGGLQGEEVEIEYRRANEDRKTSAILKSTAEIFDVRHVR